MENINLVIVDDHDLVLDGFMSLLSNVNAIKVVGKASNGQELLNFLTNQPAQEKLHLVLMDVDMPVMNGIQATKLVKAKFPGVKVLILTMHQEETLYNKLIAAQADGCIQKNVNSNELLRAIKQVMEGKGYFNNKTKRERKKKVQVSDDVVHLTNREKEVLKLIATGKSAKEIASILSISYRTVDTHRTNLKEKLKVKNTAGMIRYAFQMELL